MKPIEEVLAEHTPRLLALDGVEGTGAGSCDGAPCIRVYVRSAQVAGQLPASLDGYVVDPVVTGEIRTSP